MRFAENSTTASHTANVGIVTKMIPMPATLPPLEIAKAPAINASIEPTKTSAMISMVATHAALPGGTPCLDNHAILTNSPPTYDGVVCVTNSPASLAEMVLAVELTS